MKRKPQLEALLNRELDKVDAKLDKMRGKKQNHHIKRKSRLSALLSKLERRR